MIEGTGRHTDFRLESGKGCCVYLFKSDNTIADQIENLPKQPAPNIAYGRKNNGGEEWGYQETPTPGKENCGIIFSSCHHLGALSNVTHAAFLLCVVVQ